jgi:hypothetical protein
MQTLLRLWILTLLLAGGQLAPAAWAEPRARGRPDTHPRVIQLTGVNVTTETIDLGAPGASISDLIVISDALFQDEEPVGVHGGTCTVVQVAPVLLHCVVTFTLPAGQIAVQGLVTPERAEEEVAVTGGTGAYHAAQGTLTVLEQEDRPAHYTFRLRRAPSK